MASLHALLPSPRFAPQSASGPSSCPSARRRPLEATTLLAAIGFTVLAAAALFAGPAADFATNEAPLSTQVPAAALVVAAEVVR